MSEELDYPFEIRRLAKDEGGGWLITFPDLPGCMSDGETIEEAIENGKDAVRCWIAVTKEDGEEIPKPMKSHSGQYVQRLPKSLHARLAAAARAEDISMNQLAATFIAEGIGRSSYVSKPATKSARVAAPKKSGVAKVSRKSTSRKTIKNKKKKSAVKR